MLQHEGADEHRLGISRAPRAEVPGTVGAG
jgi:hypothetical protein